MVNVAKGDAPAQHEPTPLEELSLEGVTFLHIDASLVSFDEPAGVALGPTDSAFGLFENMS